MSGDNEQDPIFGVAIHGTATAGNIVSGATFEAVAVSSSQVAIATSRVVGGVAATGFAVLVGAADGEIKEDDVLAAGAAVGPTQTLV